MRLKQAEHLRQLLSTSHPPQCVFVTGTSGVGKTITARAVLQQLRPSHLTAFVDCTTIQHSVGLLYQHILRQLAAQVDEAAVARFFACDGGLMEFVDRLQTLQQAASAERPVVIALDKAELLRSFPQTLIPAFMRLGELTGQRVAVVLISHLIWEKFRVPVGFPADPITVSFSPYTFEEMQEILVKILLPTFKPLYDQAIERKIEGMDERKFRLLFQELFSLVYTTINRASRVLSDYARLISALFPLYIEPVLRAEVPADGVRHLATRIQPVMRSSLNKLYMGDICDLSSSKGHRKVLQLPRFTKFLLISGFLASYNPAKFDVRFFAKITEKKKVKGRKRSVKNAQGKNERLTLGPKAFPADRLLAIFYNIVDEPVDSGIDIYYQLSTLVSLRFLKRVTASLGRCLEAGMKCKCNVSYSTIKDIANSVEFDIDRYLIDRQMV